MLQTRFVWNIGILIYDYVIPTMQTKSSNNNLKKSIRYSTEITTVILILTQPISNYKGDMEKVITL